MTKLFIIKLSAIIKTIFKFLNKKFKILSIDLLFKKIGIIINKKNINIYY